MKKQTKKSVPVTFNKPLSSWQYSLLHFVTKREREALNAFNTLGMQGACTELNMSRDRCTSLLKSGLKKLSVHYRVYEQIKQKANIHLFTKRQFLSASIEDIGFSTRIYHLLKGADLNYMFQVLRIGKKGLYRIKGFGEKAMVELKSILIYKNCLDLLE